LSRDTAHDEAATSDTSLHGARIWITADGQIGYDASTVSASFKAQLQALAAGQDATDSFIYAIRLGDGTLSWATATVHFSGQNDARPMERGASTATGKIIEQADVTGSVGADSTGGTIAFADVDLSDTHSVSQTGPSFAWSGGTLSPAQLASLAGASTLSLTE